MKPMVKWSLFLGLFAGALLVATPAFAVKPFLDEFEAKYPDLKAKIGAAQGGKCNVCHMGDKKTMRNEYGVAVRKLLKKADMNNAAKIKMALDTVEKEKAANGETFGERIKAGRLPADDKK